jgi:hypothetical protein
MVNTADGRVAVVEARSITPVPDERRHGSAFALFWIGVRFPAVVSWLAGTIAGASLTTLTLSSHLTISGPFAGSWLGRNNLGWLWPTGLRHRVPVPAPGHRVRKRR